MALPDSLVAFGSLLGSVALVLEIILHYADLKRWVMRPNFQLAMYPKGSYASIVVTNTKIGNLLKDWRICDATDCEGYLAIKKHQTEDDRIFDVKETTPLSWEGEGKVYKRLPAAPLPAYLQAFAYDSVSGGVGLRIHGGYESGIPPSLRVDILVQIQAKEKTVGKWLRDVDLVQCIKTGKFPEFVDPP
jgi:hypothetical protein